MGKFIGTINGINIFTNSCIPIGKIYPTGKKDGNKLGKRKRNICFPGCYFKKDENCILVHPTLVCELIEPYSMNHSPYNGIMQWN